MKLTAKNDMSEEMVFAQKLSDDELENISGGLCGLNGGDGCGETNKWENEHCTTGHTRHIYEGGFANCAATVEDNSWCGSNDACIAEQVVYLDMTDCRKAWR